MKQSRWRRTARVVVAFGLLIFAVAALAVAYHAGSALTIARPYLDLAQQARNGDLAAIDAPAVAARLPGDLSALHRHVSALQRWAAPVLWPMSRAGGLPVVGADLQALPAVLDAGVHMLAAASSAAVLVAPVVSAVGGADDGQAGGMLPSLLELILTERQALDDAQTHAGAAVTVLSTVRQGALHRPLRQAHDRVRTLADMLETGLAAVAVAPQLLGADGLRTYLLIALNSDELRASGGFLSAAGTITLDRGRVTHFDLRDSYAGDDLSVPHPAPPEALQRLMGAGVLLLRDVNWWPDFPTSARMTMQVWDLDRKQRVDGVVALDEEGLRLIVEGLGTLWVDGEPAPIAAVDLRELLRAKWGIVPEGRQEMGAWWRHRKDFLPVLAGSVLDKVQGGLSAGEAVRLARAVMSAVDGRHLQVYAVDSAVQDAVVRLGADGSIPETGGDYLFVVDSNVGFNKVNARIEQQIAYAVDLTQPQRPRAGLTVTYTHTAAVRLDECVMVAAYGVTYDDMMDRCYWDYVRVYVPEGSTAVLDAGGPAVESGRESSKQVFASYLVTAPGSSETLRLHYTLPSTVAQTGGGAQRYSLLVQKQGGVTGHALHVSVTLPDGARVLDASPAPSATLGNTLSFDAKLDRDRTIEVTYVP